MFLDHAIVLTSAVGLPFAAWNQRGLFDAVTSIIALTFGMIVLQVPGAEYDQMTWRELYSLVQQRRFRGRRVEGGLTKSVLKKWLLESDEQKKHGTEAASGSSQKEQGKDSKLGELLNPEKRSNDWASKASTQEGKDITGMFLDVTAVPSSKTDALDPQEAVDGLIPSVAIDKFLIAADTLSSTEHIAFLFGKNHKFGKGTASCTRMVVRSMVCGLRDQFTLELLQEEARENGTEIVGIMYHEAGNAEGVAEIKEFIDGNLLDVCVGQPPPDAERFYDNVVFTIADGVAAKVKVVERGQHSLLKLRFLPDEAQETEIRKEDFSKVAVKKFNDAVGALQRCKEAATQSFSSKKEKEEARNGLAEEKLQKTQQD